VVCYKTFSRVVEREGWHRVVMSHASGEDAAKKKPLQLRTRKGFLVLRFWLVSVESHYVICLGALLALGNGEFDLLPLIQ